MRFFKILKLGVRLVLSELFDMMRKGVSKLPELFMAIFKILGVMLKKLMADLKFELLLLIGPGRFGITQEHLDKARIAQNQAGLDVRAELGRGGGLVAGLGGDLMQAIIGHGKDGIKNEFQKAWGDLMADVAKGSFKPMLDLHISTLKNAAMAGGAKLKHRFLNFLDQQRGKGPADTPAAPKPPTVAPDEIHGFGGGAGAQLGTAAGYKALLSAIHAQRKNRLDTERNRILKEIAEQNKNVEQNEGVLVAPGEG